MARISRSLPRPCFELELVIMPMVRQLFLNGKSCITLAPSKVNNNTLNYDLGPPNRVKIMTSLGETLGILSWGGGFNRNLASTGKTCGSAAHILIIIIFEIFIFHGRRSIFDLRALGQGDGRMTYIP
jgi:hypothetical protein